MGLLHVCVPTRTAHPLPYVATEIRMWARALFSARQFRAEQSKNKSTRFPAGLLRCEMYIIVHYNLLSRAY